MERFLVGKRDEAFGGCRVQFSFGEFFTLDFREVALFETRTDTFFRFNCRSFFPLSLEGSVGGCVQLGCAHVPLRTYSHIPVPWFKFESWNPPRGSLVHFAIDYSNLDARGTRNAVHYVTLWPLLEIFGRMVVQSGEGSFLQSVIMRYYLFSDPLDAIKSHPTLKVIRRSKPLRILYKNTVYFRNKMKEHMPRSAKS
jgi:hypothetical protein